MHDVADHRQGRVSSKQYSKASTKQHKKAKAEEPVCRLIVDINKRDANKFDNTVAPVSGDNCANKVHGDMRLPRSAVIDNTQCVEQLNDSGYGPQLCFFNNGYYHAT